MSNELELLMKKPLYLRDISIAGLFAVLSLSVMSACQRSEAQISESSEDMQIAHLSQGDTKNLDNIKEAFSARNPGYFLDYLKNTQDVEASEHYRVLFVQQGQPNVELSSGFQSEVTVGDIILLEPNTSLGADSALSLLQFIVPDPFPTDVPKIIRPDWDPNITDIPGGCATETNAYRRILLTWKQEVGQYLYHALNAHRVRIMDSFSHYHPQQGGFDEFYLVQMALPDASILTSNKVSAIEDPLSVSEQQAADLLKSTSLEVGDLVYLPRGIMHRGIGGVLAQVITVPGFIPGSEIGVDHHLKVINENLNLGEKEAIPFNVEASDSPVVK